MFVGRGRACVGLSQLLLSACEDRLVLTLSRWERNAIVLSQLSEPEVKVDRNFSVEQSNRRAKNWMCPVGGEALTW